ncbi:MAG: hypothetical protein M3N98_16265 [Actinomycetota bacterium]|nr:hypothetical protein [Actinomycetota bacterium]
MVSVGAVRITTLVVCGAGIAGMIVTSALNHNGAAITFGLVTAVAIVCSMVANAVAADTERRLGATSAATETLAAVVESQVEAVVAGGADETAVRQLVGEAVRLGRALGPRGS